PGRQSRRGTRPARARSAARSGGGEDERLLPDLAQRRRRRGRTRAGDGPGRRGALGAGLRPGQVALLDVRATMRLGYNTNGLAHHRMTDAIALLAEQGYRSVALTLDAGALDPYEGPAVLGQQLQAVVNLLDKHGMSRVVETGARFLLNPK